MERLFAVAGKALDIATDVAVRKLQGVGVGGWVRGSPCAYVARTNGWISQDAMCIHTYVHTYVYTYTHTYIHTYIHTYTHT
jgi:hypothetical protein